MALASDLTLRELLPGQYKKIDERMRREFDRVPVFARQDFPGFLWTIVGDKAVSAAHGMLDLNLFGVFARAWCKAQEIRRFAIESVEKPGVPIVLYLGKHKAQTSLLPLVDVTIHPFGTFRVPFELALAAEFDSAELTLFNGAIVSIGAGVCRVTAQMKLAGQAMHEPIGSPTLTLGSEHLLSPKLQIVETAQADLF